MSRHHPRSHFSRGAAAASTRANAIEMRAAADVRAFNAAMSRSRAEVAASKAAAPSAAVFGSVRRGLAKRKLTKLNKDLNNGKGVQLEVYLGTVREVFGKYFDDGKFVPVAISEFPAGLQAQIERAIAAPLDEKCPLNECKPEVILHEWSHLAKLHNAYISLRAVSPRSRALRNSASVYFIQHNRTRGGRPKFAQSGEDKGIFDVVEGDIPERSTPVQIADRSFVGQQQPGSFFVGADPETLSVDDFASMLDNITSEVGDDSMHSTYDTFGYDANENDVYTPSVSQDSFDVLSGLDADGSGWDNSYARPSRGAAARCLYRSAAHGHEASSLLPPGHFATRGY